MILRNIFRLLVAAALLGGTFIVPAEPAQAQADTLKLAWTAPEPVVTKAGDGYQVTLEGYPQLARPGYPDIPAASRLIAVPYGSQVELAVEQIESAPLRLPGSVATSPQPDGASQAVDGSIEPAFSAALQRDFSPEVVEIEPVGTVRGINLERVVFYPIRPTPAGWVFTRAIKVKVIYHSTTSLSSGKEKPDSIQKALLSGAAFPAGEQLIESRPASSPWLLSSSADGWSISVREGGITAITYKDLSAAGFPTSTTDPRRLHLIHGDQEVALDWQGDDDASFESGEKFIFFADPTFSRWDAEDAYILTEGNSPGLRMGSVSANPAGLTVESPRNSLAFENNRFYMPDCLCGTLPAGPDGDHWAWDRLALPDIPSRSYTIQVSNVDPGQPAHLAIWVVGFTDTSLDVDHRVQVSLNGVETGQVDWNGKRLVELSFDLPAGLLKSGDNTLKLAMPGLPGVATEGFYLDAVRFDYAHGAGSFGTSALVQGSQAGRRAYTLNFDSTEGVLALDVTSPATPAKLTDLALTATTVRLGDPIGAGGRYALATTQGLRTPEQIRKLETLATANLTGADYLVITHPDFAPALQDLLDLREAEGLTTAVENVQAIYDQYSGGRVDPEAIRSYLGDVYHSWHPAPTFVLLVGDGTFDPRRYLSSSTYTFIPPYLADTDPWMGETAADNRYVAVDGEDILPDMLIGRLPVNSLAEAQTVIGKIVRYETSKPLGGWNRRLEFFSDDSDAAGEFDQIAASIASVVPPDFPRELNPYNPNDRTVNGFRAKVQAAFSQGSSTILWSGHASILFWAAERFLAVEDLAGMQNIYRLPVVVEATCFTSAFHHPTFETLDEALIRQGPGGAAATWGSTGLGVTVGQNTLAQGFLTSLYSTDPGALGLATLAGKVHLANEYPAYLNLADTFTLLGDPALTLDFSNNNNYQVFLPNVYR